MLLVSFQQQQQQQQQTTYYLYINQKNDEAVFARNR